MTIRELTLREMIIERILFAVDEDVLNDSYEITEEELYHLSDTDLLDLYEDVTFDSGYGSGMIDTDDGR
jgi:hypothetical protein